MVSTLKREKKRMSKEDFNVVPFLKACSWWKDLCEDSRIHAYIVRKRVAKKKLVSNNRFDQHVC